MQRRGQGGSGATASEVLVVGAVGTGEAPETPQVQAERQRWLGADLLQVLPASGASPGAVLAVVEALAAEGPLPVGCAVHGRGNADAAVAAGAAFLVVTGSARGVPAVARGGFGAACWFTEVPAETATPWREHTGGGAAVLAALPAAPVSIGATVGLAVAALKGGCRAVRGADVRTLRRTVDACLPLLAQRRAQTSEGE